MKCISWASCQIRKIAGTHAPGMPGTFSPSPQVSDPDMHRGTCGTHVPWCMPGSLTSGFLWNRRRGKTFPAFPAHAQPAILRIWQEAHESLGLGTVWCYNENIYFCLIKWLIFPLIFTIPISIHIPTATNMQQIFLSGIYIYICILNIATC